jgi:hypothetical protein
MGVPQSCYNLVVNEQQLRTFVKDTVNHPISPLPPRAPCPPELPTTKVKYRCKKTSVGWCFDFVIALASRFLKVFRIKESLGSLSFLKIFKTKESPVLEF